MKYAAILLGRCSNGAERDQGHVVHLVDYGDKQDNAYHAGKAVCGAEPGRRSAGWSTTMRSTNCPRCLKRAQSRLTPDQSADNQFSERPK